MESNKKIAGPLCNNWNFPLYESSIYLRELSVLVNWYEINDKILKITGHDISFLLRSTYYVVTVQLYIWPQDNVCLI